MSEFKKDRLLLTEKSLERALAQSSEGREQAWLDDLRKALSQMEGAMFRHESPSEGQLLKPQESAEKEPFPRLTREVEALRQEHTGISQQLNALLAGTHLATPASDDFVRIREAGAKLLQALREFRETENKLVIETALRDTGTGD